MKYWRWFVSALLILTILISYNIGTPNVQMFIRSVVFSTDDFIWLRQVVHSFMDEEEQVIPVTTNRIISYEEIEPYEDGFLVKTSDDQIRSFSEGIILFTGSTKEYGKMVNIYYDAEQLYVSIGFLHELKQLPYVVVQEGDLIGTLNRRKEFYIQLKQNDKVLTYEETLQWLQNE